VAIVGLLGWFVYASRHMTELPAESRRKAYGFGGRIKAYLSGFIASTRPLTSGPRFAGALAISLFAWALQVATFQAAASAAHVVIPPAASMAGLLATNLGLIIRATPGNVGFFQFVYVLAVAPFGVDREAAIAVSLLIQTVQIIPISIAGVALAPEFIFRRADREETEALVRRHEPSMLGGVTEEGEELAGASREP
jgi:uncharacterized membrane protein YbhN (UPF0104 family)